MNKKQELFHFCFPSDCHTKVGTPSEDSLKTMTVKESVSEEHLTTLPSDNIYISDVLLQTNANDKITNHIHVS